MAQSALPFGEWRPDLALLDNQFAADVENVFAGSNSYMPIPGLAPFSDALIPPPPATEPVCGLTSARTAAGEWKVYGGTTKKLYSWNTGTGWVDASRTVGGDYTVPGGELWSFAQFGTKLYAANINDPLQVIDIDSGTNFALAPGSPPQAHHVNQLGDFLILSGLTSNRRKIQWSGINDPTNWVSGIGLSGDQEFPDGGPVQGVCGSEIGYVVQDRAIRTMQFLPGDTKDIFSFSRVLEDKGSISEFGYCSVNNQLFFLAEDGFYSVAGAQIVPIGHEKVNEWFLANSDISKRNLVQAFVANKPYVGWAFHTNGSSVQYYDTTLLYNWALQRWTKVRMTVQMWSMLASVGLDLDTDGAEPGDTDLDSAARSLDSFAYVGGRPLIAAVNDRGELSTLTGPNLQATLETVEGHPVPGMRAFISNAYPLADADQAQVACGTRERLQDPVFWNPAEPLEITGSASVLTSARLHRYRVIIPAGDVWTHAQGVIVEAQPDGMA